jgi:hypothetical protein
MEVRDLATPPRDASDLKARDGRRHFKVNQ